VTGLLYLYLNFQEPSGSVQASNGTATYGNYTLHYALSLPGAFPVVKVKVKQSRYRPGVAQRVPGS
jgi:hypothetical protein